jgi:predicted DNA binding protein
MVTIVEFRVPIDQFALAHTFNVVSDLYVEIQRIIATSTDSPMPLIWVATNDFEVFEATLADDLTVESFSCLSGFNKSQQYYRICWSDAVELVVDLFCEGGGMVTQARTSGDFWEFEAMFPYHTTLSSTYAVCEENELALTIDSVSKLDSNRQTQFGLTDTQQQTLLMAQKMGFYNVPRELSITDLAATLNISHQAVSERLRRAQANLIEQTIAAAEPHPEDHFLPNREVNLTNRYC